jgi:PhnB protein
MAKLNAYLTFSGNCKEAMEFYKSCLGGELTLMTVGESPMAAQTPVAMRDSIMHSLLTSGSINLMASDMMGQGEFKPGNTIHLCLVCESKEEIERLFAKLSQGAQAVRPLKEEFFGTYGDLTDKFGFGWMFQFGGNQQR